MFRDPQPNALLVYRFVRSQRILSRQFHPLGLSSTNFPTFFERHQQQQTDGRIVFLGCPLLFDMRQAITKTDNLPPLSLELQPNIEADIEYFHWD